MGKRCKSTGSTQVAASKKAKTLTAASSISCNVTVCTEAEEEAMLVQNGIDTVIDVDLDGNTSERSVNSPKPDEDEEAKLSE